MNIWEDQYIEIIEKILRADTYPDRTGIGCRKILNAQIKINLNAYAGAFPTSTLRLQGARIGFTEFWAFLNGIVHIDEYLRSHDVTYKDASGTVKTIWTDNTSREFLDSRGLHQLPEGHLGKSYGFQFRNWGGNLDPYTDYLPDFSGVDQIASVWESIKHDPFSRRHVVTLLNPEQEFEMALVPCWHTHHFTVTNPHANKHQLNLTVTARSADVLYGTPTNVQQYSLYLIAMAKSLGMTPGMLCCNLEDAHLYENQITYARELVETRSPLDSGIVTIKKELSTLEDVLSLRWSDIELIGDVNRVPLKTIKPPMAI